VVIAVAPQSPSSVTYQIVDAVLNASGQPILLVQSARGAAGLWLGKWWGPGCVPTRLPPQLPVYVTEDGITLHVPDAIPLPDCGYLGPGPTFPKRADGTYDFDALTGCLSRIARTATTPYSDVIVMVDGALSHSVLVATVDAVLQVEDRARLFESVRLSPLDRMPPGEPQRFVLEGVEPCATAVVVVTAGQVVDAKRVLRSFRSTLQRCCASSAGGVARLDFSVSELVEVKSGYGPGPAALANCVGPALQRRPAGPLGCGRVRFSLELATR